VNVKCDETRAPSFPCVTFVPTHVFDLRDFVEPLLNFVAVKREGSFIRQRDVEEFLDGLLQDPKVEARMEGRAKTAATVVLHDGTDDIVKDDGVPKADYVIEVM